MATKKQLGRIPDLHGIVRNADKWKVPILIGIPTLGTVRFEWTNAMWNVVIPINWASSMIAVPVPVISPLRYHVAEAQNIIVKTLLDGKQEWLMLLEDDVIVPPDVLVRFREWVNDGRYPVVSGLYNLKSVPPEPFVFRGRGNGGETKWKPGSKVWVDGIPTGCCIIHRRLLEVCWKHAKELTLRRLMADGSVLEIKTREVFVTRREAGIDPETGGYYKRGGTSDLEWCDEVINNGYLKEAGFTAVARKKYPFVIDTRIKCGHIELSTGVVY